MYNTTFIILRVVNIPNIKPIYLQQQKNQKKPVVCFQIFKYIHIMLSICAISDQ